MLSAALVLPAFGGCWPRSAVPAQSSSGAGQDLFVMPDDGPDPVLAELDRAHESIRVVAYVISDDDTVDALISARQRGVSVRVMLDQAAFGPGAAGADVIAGLRAAGVPIRPGSPAHRLTHQKTIVVDERTALVMNMNLSSSGFTRNREYNVRDTEPAHVAEITRVFDADWDRAAAASSAVPSAPGLVWSPDNARDRLTEHLRAAATSVDIAVELFTDQAVMSELAALAARGVTVRVLLPQVEAEGDENEAALADLAGRDVRVRRLAEPRMHAKLVLVDGRRAFIGSQNLTYSGLELNRELGVLVTDPAAVTRAAAVFADDWRRAR